MAAQGRGVAGSTWAAPSWVQQGRSGLWRALSRPGRDRRPGSQAGKRGPCGVPGRLGRAGLQGRGRFVTAASKATDAAAARGASPARRFARSRGKAGSEANPSPQQHQDGTGEQRRATLYGETPPGPMSASHTRPVRVGLPTPAAGPHPAGQRRTRWPPPVLRAPPEKGKWAGGQAEGTAQGKARRAGSRKVTQAAGEAQEMPPGEGRPWRTPILRITAGQRRGEAGLCNPRSRGVTESSTRGGNRNSPEPPTGAGESTWSDK